MLTQTHRKALLRALAIAFTLAIVGASIGLFLAQQIARRYAVPAASASRPRHGSRRMQ